MIVFHQNQVNQEFYSTRSNSLETETQEKTNQIILVHKHQC